MLSAHPVAILQDNYAWLLRDSATGATAIVDPAEPGPVAAAIDAAGGRLDLILLTDHHSDHVAGTDDIRDPLWRPVVGARADAHRLPRLDQAVGDGDSVVLGELVGKVIDTAGHTRGQVAFYFADGGVLICGDTLFSLGCGRLLEGTAAEHVRFTARIGSPAGARRWCAAATNTPKATRVSRCMPIPTMRPCRLMSRTSRHCARPAGRACRAACRTSLRPTCSCAPPTWRSFAALRARKDKF